ncbi:MAG: pyridoxamine 5'-phosphate oxidase family protein [Sphingobium sp.]
MTDTVRKQFWKALEASPFLLVNLQGATEHALPMTAQLDKDADSAFWFYTSKGNRLETGGPAMAHFSAKGHDLFACIAGTLRTETDPAVIDRYWSKQVEAWYDGGRNDPNLLMLRFDLDDAEVWTADLGVKGLFKLLTGKHIDPQEAGKHEQIAL